MAFDINAFKAQLDIGGTIKTSNFEVLISHPKLQIPPDLRFRCSEVDLPGRSISSIDHKVVGYSEKLAYESTFSDLSLGIILSEDMFEKELFEKWQDLAVGNYRTQNNYSNTMFDLGYYDDYVGTVDIRVFNDVGDMTATYKLHEAWPVSVGDISLSWSNGAELAILRVTLYYAYYTTS